MRFRSTKSKKQSETSEGTPHGTINEAKKTEETEDDPRDKGWAWVIALAIAVYNCLLAGTAKANGVMYLEFLELYAQNPSTTAWVRSSFSLAQTAASPLSGHLRDRMSFRSTRIIIFIAIIVWALSLCVAAWMPNVEAIIICYSLFGGVTSGILFTLIFSLIPIYFVERKSLASGIALGGGSIGGLVVPILIASLTEIYGIRGTLTILGGLYLHGLLVAAVMIQLKKPKVKGMKSEPPLKGKCAGDNTQLGSDSSYVNKAFDRDQEGLDVEVESENDLTSVLEGKSKTSELQTLDNGNSDKDSITESCDALKEKTVDLATNVTSSSHNCDKDLIDEARNSPKNEDKKLEPSPQTNVTKSQEASASNEPKQEATFRNIDIKSKIKELKIVKAIMTYIDFLRTPHIIPLTLVFLCSSFGYYTQFFVLVPFATELGTSKVMASTLISILSIAELFGRIVTGFIADRLGRNKLWILLVSFPTSFIIGIIVTIFPSTNLLYAFATIFGIFGGMYMPLVIPMTTDLVPTYHFGKATGLMPIVVGIGSAAGNQLSTMVYEATGSYRYSFMLCVMMYLGALLFFGVYAFGIHRKRKERNKLTITLNVEVEV